MILTKLLDVVQAAIFFTLIFQASPSDSLHIRDSDSVWRSLITRSDSDGVLTVALTNNDDKVYSVPVRLGTPFQEIEMAVSLGQPFITLANPDTPGKSGYYNPNSSTTFIPGYGADQLIVDISGHHVDCRLYSELFEIQNLTLKMMTICITPKSAKETFYPDGFHGVLGYGVQLGDNLRPWYNLISDQTLLGKYFGLIPSKECGIELNRKADGVGGGVLTMGGRDRTAYTGDVTSIQVLNYTTENIDFPSWVIPLDGLYADVAGYVDNIVSGQVFATIDLYYPTINLPAFTVKRLYSRVSQAKVSHTNPHRYTVPCDTKINITMTFGGKNFTMDPRDAITKEGNTCFGIVEIGDIGLLQIGSPFLRNVYTIIGATVGNGKVNFTVSLADKVQRTVNGTSSGGSAAPKPKNTARIAVSHNVVFVSLSLLVVASVSMIVRAEFMDICSCF